MSIEPEKLRKSAYIDVEAMLAACVPGGSIADPQAIADAIRAWVAEQPSAQEPNHPEIPDSSSRPAGPAAVPQIWRTTVSAVISALDEATGDTDPCIDPEMTDDDIRSEYPEVWAMQQLSNLLAAREGQ